MRQTSLLPEQQQAQFLQVSSFESSSKSVSATRSSQPLPGARKTYPSQSPLTIPSPSPTPRPLLPPRA